MQHEFKYRPENMTGQRIVDIPVVLTLGPITCTIGADAGDWELYAMKINGVDLELDHPLAEAVFDFAERFAIFDEVDERWLRRNTTLEIA